MDRHSWDSLQLKSFGDRDEHFFPAPRRGEEEDGELLERGIGAERWSVVLHGM